MLQVPLLLHEGHAHHPSVEGKQSLADSIWEQEHIELVTVGIDIGSSTSHLLFAKIHLQRRTQGLSSRYEVVARDILWESPIRFTPFSNSGLIDAVELEQFIQSAYFEAGLHAEDIDSGAVILTGEAIKRANAKAIDELFAQQAGKFVCATAGHRLESILSAHGSGAVARSKELGKVIIHVDIGGGTTKLALIDSGKILSVAAYAIGGRLLASDDGVVWNRCEQSIFDVSSDIGIILINQSPPDQETSEEIVKRLSSVLGDVLARRPHDDLMKKLLLTEPLSWSCSPELISFSGGVSEYIYGREAKGMGDIAQDLAKGILSRVNSDSAIPDIVTVNHGIRATVIGASQFTVQVSGKTIFSRNLSYLPLRNVPVVHPGLDLSSPDLNGHKLSLEIAEACKMRDVSATETVALAINWDGEPSYPRLRALSDGIAGSMCCQPRKYPLILVFDGDVGRLVGRMLAEELGCGDMVLSLDGVILSDLDFIDVGEMITPPSVIPIVIKSLVFDSAQHTEH